MPSQIVTELLKGVFTVASLGVGAHFAAKAFFRQKEYELIKQRYLDGSVDVIAAEVESALGKMHHNWARSVNLVKLYRDTGTMLDPSELAKGFVELDSSKFQDIAHHRLSRLIGSNAIWNVFQATVAFAFNSNSKCVKEIPDAIRLLAAGTVVPSASHDETIEEMFAVLVQINDNSHRFAKLLGELANISQLLEQRQLSLKSVEEFKHLPEVTEIVSRLEAEFPDAKLDAEGHGA